MQPSDVTMYGRDYSAREFTPEEFDRYERENPSERPVQWLDRYIGYPGNAKCISHYPGMYERHWESGRPVSLFHQIGYTDMEGGYDRGRAHAQVAKADAERVGWHGESHITACMDRFYAKAGYRTLTRDDLREYMRGYRSVLGDRSGFYGFYDSMWHAVAEGWASFYVQCGARSAHVPGIHAWQENNYQPKVFGTGTDILELYTTPDYAFAGGGIMTIQNARDGMAQLLGEIRIDLMAGRWNEQADTLRELFWGTPISVVDEKQLVPSDDDPKQLVPAAWEDRAEKILSSTNRHAAWAEKYGDELVKRAMAEIDEAELAEELDKLGVGGASAADIKSLMIELLGRVTLGVLPPGQPKALEQ